MEGTGNYIRALSAIRSTHSKEFKVLVVFGRHDLKKPGETQQWGPTQPSCSVERYPHWHWEVAMRF